MWAVHGKQVNFLPHFSLLDVVHACKPIWISFEVRLGLEVDTMHSALLEDFIISAGFVRLRLCHNAAPQRQPNSMTKHAHRDHDNKENMLLGRHLYIIFLASATCITCEQPITSPQASVRWVHWLEDVWNGLCEHISNFLALKRFLTWIIFSLFVLVMAPVFDHVWPIQEMFMVWTIQLLMLWLPSAVLKATEAHLAQLGHVTAPYSYPSFGDVVTF